MPKWYYISRKRGGNPKVKRRNIMKYATKVMAKEIINKEKELNETNYFSGDLKMKDMKEMLRYRMGFGEAETNFILASMVNAGAKFIFE